MESIELFSEKVSRITSGLAKLFSRKFKGTGFTTEEGNDFLNELLLKKNPKMDDVMLTCFRYLVAIKVAALEGMPVSPLNLERREITMFYIMTHKEQIAEDDEEEGILSTTSISSCPKCDHVMFIDTERWRHKMDDLDDVALCSQCGEVLVYDNSINNFIIMSKEREDLIKREFPEHYLKLLLIKEIVKDNGKQGDK